MLLIFAICAFVLIGLLWKIRGYARWESDGHVIAVSVKLRLFYGVIAIHAYRSFDLRQSESFDKILERDRLLRALAKRIGKSKEKKKKNSAFRVRKIECRVHLGIRDDAFAAALCAGCIQILFECISAALARCFSGFVTLDSSASVFRIKLEGIIDFYPMQIILAALKRQVSKIRGKNNAASD